MILAFNPADLITVPFGYVMDYLYQFTNNYGLALILFAIVVKLVLLPATAKGKKSTMRMSRLTPRIQAIQKKYANDQQKQNEAIQALYKEEGVSMGGGCLWSFVPLLLLLPLYSVVREPITYILHEPNSELIVNTIKGVEEFASKFAANRYYDQMVAASLISKPAAQEALTAAGIALKDGVVFDFLGVDLATIPDWKIWAWGVYDWAHIGAFLIPLLSAGSQVLSMFLSNKMNNSLVTNEKGIEDKETAKNSQSNQSGKIMMWMMPAMSLWIGFQFPVAMSLYWLIQGLLSMVVDLYLTKKYRKIYDAEDAERLQKALAAEAVEAEKERIRAERRAANPDGITENTSKKKLQQKQRQEQEAAKAAAAKEYAAKKGIVEEEAPEKQPLSGVTQRPYCKGRAYDPNRYNTEE